MFIRDVLNLKPGGRYALSHLIRKDLSRRAIPEKFPHVSLQGCFLSLLYALLLKTYVHLVVYHTIT